VVEAKGSAPIRTLVFGVYVSRLLVILLVAACTASAQGLRAGAAQVVVTPPVGAPMAGYYTNRAATGTHDDLYAKAIVFEKNGVKVVLVACDLVDLPREFSEQARRIIQQKTGIAADHVMISVTHTHTGPVILTQPSRYNLEGEMKRIAEEYSAAFPAKIADAVVLANERLQLAQVRSAIGKEASLGFNRRYFMKDGTVGWNPGKLNPNILRPAGPTDPAVPVVYVETLDGKGIASYVNFAVHLDTTGGLQFSADYAYTLGKILTAAKGQDLISMFTIGCAGNVNHLDTSTKDPQSSFGEAARIGAVLAGEVLKTIQHAPLVPVSDIRVSTRTLKFDVQHFSATEMEWAHRTQNAYGTPNAPPLLDLARAGKMIAVEARHGQPLEAEVQVIALGDQIAFVSFPGEMFTELGLALKEDSPYPITIAAELANGWLGYIPNSAAYPQGQYEVVSSPVGSGAGEELVASALGQLRALYALPKAESKSAPAVKQSSPQ
jgi:neutral ceramidase